MSKSILQDRKECYLCGQMADIQSHHIMFGVAHRSKAEQHGLKVYLCRYHHTDAPYGVHHNRKIDLMLKADAQKAFEKKYGHDMWMKEFGRNYL